MGLLGAFVTISEYASVVVNIHCHFGFLKHIFKVFFSHLFLFCKLPHLEKQNPESHFEEEEYRPSPSALVSLIPFPVSVEYITAAAIKEKLSVTVYNRVAERLKNESHDDDGGGGIDPPACAVCLDNLEAIQEVRELHNCRHLYHRQCLDAWVERGHVTCPICRAKLLAEDHMSHREVEGEEPRDPWRSERMMYLFGEDVLF